MVALRLSPELRQRLHEACCPSCRDGGECDGDEAPDLNRSGKALIRQGDRFLVIQSPSGFWGFPGGHLKAGESRADALRREVREECGLELEHAEPLMTETLQLGDTARAVDFYRATVGPGEVELSDEHTEARWCTPDEMRELDMGAYAPLLDRLTEGQGEPCKKGETAARSGCVPASGEGGEVAATQQQATSEVRDATLGERIMHGVKGALGIGDQADHVDDAPERGGQTPETGATDGAAALAQADVKPGGELTPEKLEAASSLVHDSWMAREHAREGGVRPDKAHLMVPYDQLDDAEKEKDRGFVRQEHANNRAFADGTRDLAASPEGQAATARAKGFSGELEDEPKAARSQVKAFLATLGDVARDPIGATSRAVKYVSGLTADVWSTLDEAGKYVAKGALRTVLGMALGSGLSAVAVLGAATVAGTVGVVPGAIAWWALDKAVNASSEVIGKHVTGVTKAVDAAKKEVKREWKRVRKNRAKREERAAARTSRRTESAMAAPVWANMAARHVTSTRADGWGDLRESARRDRWALGLLDVLAHTPCADVLEAADCLDDMGHRFGAMALREGQGEPCKRGETSARSGCIPAEKPARSSRSDAAKNREGGKREAKRELPTLEEIADAGGEVPELEGPDGAVIEPEAPAVEDPPETLPDPPEAEAAVAQAAAEEKAIRESTISPEGAATAIAKNMASANEGLLSYLDPDVLDELSGAAASRFATTALLPSELARIMAQNPAAGPELERALANAIANDPAHQAMVAEASAELAPTPELRAAIATAIEGSPELMAPVEPERQRYQTGRAIAWAVGNGARTAGQVAASAARWVAEAGIDGLAAMANAAPDLAAGIAKLALWPLVNTPFLLAGAIVGPPLGIMLASSLVGTGALLAMPWASAMAVAMTGGLTPLAIAGAGAAWRIYENKKYGQDHASDEAGISGAIKMMARTHISQGGLAHLDEAKDALASTWSTRRALRATDALGRKAAARDAAHWGSESQPYFRPGPNPTVDMVVTREGAEGQEVLLIQRGEGTAGAGEWALPGGFVDTSAEKGKPHASGTTETPQAAALRELSEETGLDASSLKDHMLHVGQFGSMDRPTKRDPRDNAEAWSVSNAYHVDGSKLPAEALAKVKGGSDATKAEWVSVSKLGERKMAFDHGAIFKRSGDVRTAKANEAAAIEARRADSAARLQRAKIEYAAYKPIAEKEARVQAAKRAESEAAHASWKANQESKALAARQTFHDEQVAKGQRFPTAQQINRGVQRPGASRVTEGQGEPCKRGERADKSGCIPAQRGANAPGGGGDVAGPITPRQSAAQKGAATRRARATAAATAAASMTAELPVAERVAVESTLDAELYERFAQGDEKAGGLALARLGSIATDVKPTDAQGATLDRAMQVAGAQLAQDTPAAAQGQVGSFLASAVESGAKDVPGAFAHAMQAIGDYVWGVDAAVPDMLKGALRFATGIARAVGLALPIAATVAAFGPVLAGFGVVPAVLDVLLPALGIGGAAAAALTTAGKAAWDWVLDPIAGGMEDIVTAIPKQVRAEREERESRATESRRKKPWERRPRETLRAKVMRDRLERGTKWGFV